VVIQQHSRKLLMMDILMSETFWVHKWNKIASDIKLVFYSSAVHHHFKQLCLYWTVNSVYLFNLTVVYKSVRNSFKYIPFKFTKLESLKSTHDLIKIRKTW
jgi:hypothetical protein